MVLRFRLGDLHLPLRASPPPINIRPVCAFVWHAFTCFYILSASSGQFSVKSVNSLPHWLIKAISRLINGMNSLTRTRSESKWALNAILNGCEWHSNSSMIDSVIILRPAGRKLSSLGADRFLKSIGRWIIGFRQIVKLVQLAAPWRQDVSLAFTN